MSGRYVVSLALLIVLSTASLVGQGLTGQLSGSVQDSSGGAMAGVQVMLVNDGHGPVARNGFRYDRHLCFRAAAGRHLHTHHYGSGIQEA